MNRILGIDTGLKPYENKIIVVAGLILLGVISLVSLFYDNHDRLFSLLVVSWSWVVVNIAVKRAKQVQQVLSILIAIMVFLAFRLNDDASLSHTITVIQIIGFASLFVVVRNIYAKGYKHRSLTKEEKISASPIRDSIASYFIFLLGTSSMYLFAQNTEVFTPTYGAILTVLLLVVCLVAIGMGDKLDGFFSNIKNTDAEPYEYEEILSNNEPPLPKQNTIKIEPIEEPPKTKEEVEEQLKKPSMRSNETRRQMNATNRDKSKIREEKREREIEEKNLSTRKEKQEAKEILHQVNEVRAEIEAQKAMAIVKNNIDSLSIKEQRFSLKQQEVKLSIFNESLKLLAKQINADYQNKKEQMRLDTERKGIDHAASMHTLRVKYDQATNRIAQAAIAEKKVQLSAAELDRKASVIYAIEDGYFESEDRRAIDAYRKQGITIESPLVAKLMQLQAEQERRDNKDNDDSNNDSWLTSFIRDHY